MNTFNRLISRLSGTEVVTKLQGLGMIAAIAGIIVTAF